MLVTTVMFFMSYTTACGSPFSRKEVNKSSTLEFMEGIEENFKILLYVRLKLSLP